MRKKMFMLSCVCGAVLSAGCNCSPKAADNAELRKLVEVKEVNFDTEFNMIADINERKAADSRIEAGVKVHQSSLNLRYALALLDLGDEEYKQRAYKVIRASLQAQDKVTYHKQFGNFAKYNEEPLQEDKKADFNMANFNGETICHILNRHGKELPADLRKELEVALEYAAWSIFRRNVIVGYTNIAVMGAGVTGFAGEYFNIPFLNHYSNELLSAVYEHASKAGELSEYNSPTYTFIALRCVESILTLSKDKQLLATAEKLQDFMWSNLAPRYHVATGQLAGPHARTYSETLQYDRIDTLAKSTNGVVALSNYTPTSEDKFLWYPVEPLPCPEKYMHYFTNPDSEDREIVKKFPKQGDNSVYRTIVTFMNKDFTIGSSERENLWYQRRPLLAYWNNGSDEPAILKLIAEKDDLGMGFSSAGVWTYQDKNKVLFSVGALSDHGDLHCVTDVNPDHKYFMKKLVIRLELIAKDAKVEKIGNDTYTLTSGDYSAIIQCGNGIFLGKKSEWRAGSNETGAYVEAVLCELDESKGIVFDSNLECFLNGAVEIVKNSDSKVVEPIKESDNTVSWKGLTHKVRKYAQKL